MHRWFNFIAGFSPEFVTRSIQQAALPGTAVVLDPFAGLSTTLVQAGAEGVNSVGFEPHPFFYDISLAKIARYTCGDVEAVGAITQSVSPYPDDLAQIWKPDAFIFLMKLQSELNLRLLASALLAQQQVDQHIRPLYRLVISRVLEHCSFSQTDGIYKAPATKKTSIPYPTALVTVLKEIQEDVILINERPAAPATLYQASSERMQPLETASVSLCITSPPYLNNFDFAEMTRMQLYFWRYAGSWHDITDKVRRKLIVNTTTAPSDFKRNQVQYKAQLSKPFIETLQPLVEALTLQKKLKPGKKEYDRLVYPYFAQMSTVIRELHRVMRPGSSLHMVVGDAALYGVHIRTHQLLATLMEDAGFEVLDLATMRTRGDRWTLTKRQGPGGPLGEFHIHARRLKD